MTATQVGFGTGLLLVVPFGDLVENRRLVLILTGLTAVALLGAALSTTPMPFLVSFSHDKLRDLASDNWRIDAAGEPPLAMTATGLHLTDLFIDLVGPINSVAAFPANRVAFANSADVLSLELRFACGATGYINAILATPFYARLIIYGSEAWVKVRSATHPDQARPSTLTFQPRTGPSRTSTLEWKSAVRANLKHFALSIEGRALYPFTDEQIVGNIAVLAAVKRSVAAGQIVAICELG